MDVSLFWPANAQPLVKILLMLIGVLFLFGLALSLKSLALVAAERRAAQELSKRKGLMLDPLTVVIQLGESKHRLAGSLLLSMLQQQGLAFARPSDALEPVLDRAARLVTPARTVPNLLLLFGLIGTVVGLIFTLSSLGPQIQGAINAGDPKDVAQSLGRTLREMSGAFAGTLWGVTGAFLLQALNAWAGVQAEKLAGELDMVSLQFAPHIYPAGNEKQIASLSDLVRRSEQFLAETQSKISDTSDKFAQVLQQASGVIEQSLRTLETTSKDISRALQQASGDVRQSSEHLTSAVNAIKDHQQDFRNIYSAFSEMFDQSMQALKLHSDGELKEIRELQAAFGNSGSLIVQEIFRSAQKMDQISQDLVNGEAAYLRGTQDISTSIRVGFDHLDTQIGATLSTYTAEVNQVSARLDGLRDTLGLSQAASTALERTLRAKDAAEHTRLKDQLSSEQTLMVATARLATTLEQLSPVITSLQDGPTQLVEGLASRQEQLLDGWRAHRDQAHTQLLQATVDMHGRLEALLGALGSVGDRVERSGQQQQTAGQDLQSHTKELVVLGHGLLDQLTRQAESLEQQLGTVMTGHLTLANTVENQQVSTSASLEQMERRLEEAGQVLQGLLTHISRQADMEAQRQSDAGATQETLRTALNDNREVASQLARLLEALPAQLQTAELVHSQTQLASTMSRLVGGLDQDLPAVAEGQPA